jgi:membrane-anchored protein YejM (alkaline phosphatase superfamily)
MLPGRARRLVSGQVWLLVALECAWLCGAYVQAIRPESALGALFVHAGRISCAASLSLVPGLLLLVGAAWVRSRHLLGALTSLLWSLVLLALYVDTRIWALFRYHFNGLVWNVLTTSGADEAVHLAPRDIGWVLAGFAASVTWHYAVFQRLWTRAERRGAEPELHWARPSLAWSVVLVPAMALVAWIYAWADLRRYAPVMAYARVYPLYPRLTIRRFAQQYLGIERATEVEVDWGPGGIWLDYPRAPITADPAGPRPNVLVVVIDSLRADMLTAEVMPRTTAFAERARNFRDHLSSGNATRFGLFGLLYGLHGSYWSSIVDEHRSPVLVDVLLAAGYDLGVFTSASMDFPEFRSTAWVRIEDHVQDLIPFARPGGRDDGTLERFRTWLSARSSAQPFFAFVLLDAPHQTYSFPEEYAQFRPFVDEVAYSTIDDDAPAAARTALFNRYRNAVHYADAVTGSLLELIDAAGLREQTLVAVTGDHGEEFFESGVWGHTSNFTRAQTAVPFLLAGPGIPTGVEERPTSHIDFPATVLEFLGVSKTARADWTLGGNLLDPPPTRARVASGWDTLGITWEDAVLEVPMASHGGTEIGVYDALWQPRTDGDEILKRAGLVLGTLARECRQFLK